MRSVPGEEIAIGNGPVTVVAEDDLGGRATGQLTLGSSNGDQKTDGLLTLDGPLNGVPGHAPIPFEAEWRSATIRTLGIEIETEEGVAEPSAVDFQGQEVTLESCLAQAGLEVREVGEESRIPANPMGWGISELHTLMTDFAAGELGERALGAAPAAARALGPEGPAGHHVRRDRGPAHGREWRSSPRRSARSPASTTIAS